MSANAPHMVDCPECKTQGTIPDPSGRRESDTGYALEIECPTCKGDGVVIGCIECGEPLSADEVAHCEKWAKQHERKSVVYACPSCEDAGLRDEAGDAAYRGSIGD